MGCEVQASVVVGRVACLALIETNVALGEGDAFGGKQLSGDRRGCGLKRGESSGAHSELSIGQEW